MPTLIDFAGDYGSRVPFSVYQVERDASGQPQVQKAIFVPHAAQVEFFSATERHVLLHGNRGCGKSASLLWKAIQTAYLVPGCRVAIYRKTWPELQRSIWDELLKLPQDLYQDLNASNHTVTIRAKDADGTWKLSKIWFVTAQNVEDARKVLGFEVHTLLIDEWAEVEHEIWRFMSGSVRSPMSTDIAGRPASAQILGASTPGGAGAEALKCLFGCDGQKMQVHGEDKITYRPEQYRAIKASIDQNPTYAVGTPAGDDYRSSLKDLPPAIQAKWIRGEWGAVEGRYFAIWDAARMVIPFAQIAMRWWDSHFLSIDYGFGRSSAAAHLHVCLQDGRIVTIGEIVARLGGEKPADVANRWTERCLSAFLRVSDLDREDKISNGRVREFVRHVCGDWSDVLPNPDADANTVFRLPRWPRGRGFGSRLAKWPLAPANGDDSSTHSTEETEEFILGAQESLIQKLRGAIYRARREAVIETGKNISSSPKREWQDGQMLAHQGRSTRIEDPERHKRTDEECFRLGVIFRAIESGKKGSDYRNFLTDHGLATPDSWRADGCPDSYRLAGQQVGSRGRLFLRRINVEKSRYATTRSKLQKKDPSELHRILEIADSGPRP